MSTGRSVIMVTVDSLRADHCHFMGYDRALTPTLDRLAEEGLAFSQAIAPGPATGRSVPATMTGTGHIEASAGSDSALERRDVVARHLQARETIAERFSRMGYETGAFTTNPWTSRRYNYDLGFDHFEDFVGGATEDGGTPDLRGNSLVGRIRGHVRDWWSNSDVFIPWEAYFDDVVEWLRGADRPYFLWVFLIDVHMPYHPPARYRSRSAVTTGPAHLWLLGGGNPRYGRLFRSTLLDAYDDTIRYVDEFLDRLMAEVGTDPLVVVHGDHGEEFGEHGAYGHGSTLCEEVVHVPLVVANGPSGRVERPVSLCSLPRLLPALARGETPDVTEPYVYTGSPTHLAVRGEDWKYVWEEDRAALYRLDDGDERRTTDEDLERLGRRLVDEWQEALAEKRRVTAGAQAVCEREAL